MIALTLGELAGIVEGELAPGTDPAAILRAPAFFDSREPVPGGLFAAFDGANTDGHEYAAAAIGAGAVAMLGSRDVGVPAVIVPTSRPRSASWPARCCGDGCRTP